MAVFGQIGGMFFYLLSSFESLKLLSLVLPGLNYFMSTSKPRKPDLQRDFLLQYRLMLFKFLFNA